jgi:hypothetical protein
VSLAALLAVAAAALPVVANAQPPGRGPGGPGPRGGEQVRTIDHMIELSLSDDALQAQYIRTLDIDEVGPTEVRGGFFYNEDRDLIAIGDFLAILGDPAAERRRIEIKAGTRVYGAFLNLENNDVFSISLGGEAEYFLGRGRGTSVKLSAFYGPDIITFGTADNVKDVSLRLQTRLRGGTDVFVGYREFEFSLLDGDREVDDNIHVGFRRAF